MVNMMLSLKSIRRLVNVGIWERMADVLKTSMTLLLLSCMRSFTILSLQEVFKSNVPIPKMSLCNLELSLVIIGLDSIPSLPMKKVAPFWDISRIRTEDKHPSILPMPFVMEDSSGLIQTPVSPRCTRQEFSKIVPRSIISILTIPVPITASCFRLSVAVRGNTR